MDTPKPSFHPHSMRVLTRPPAPASSSDHQPPPPPPPTQSQPRSLEGIVVVGFVSNSPDHSSQLINRILDCNAFGSGCLDKVLLVDKEEAKDWFKWRRISYYHDEEKGILFLQFYSTQCPVVHGISGSESGLVCGLEERDFEELQGLLFMLSVCHIIINIQEGSRFETHILKKFRVLQAAKHVLLPRVSSRTPTTLSSRSNSSPSSSMPTSSTGSSPGRSGGIMSRNASAISVMSGLGSYASLFPGHCTPVLLFVFVDDFLDPGSTVEESTDASSLGQSSNLSGLARPNLPTKGSGSVVVLARPVSKSEGGFKKKLQSSLESQIRFLIKEFRTLSGSESSHSGSRSSDVSNSAPLFSLDASRAVVLLDRSTNQKGESLEFATELVEDVLNGKATSDSLLLESHSQSANKEDILSIKKFIYRQCDILRGRGGLVTSSNSGSAAGVGMVVVAAAAAAASAASGKTVPASELPCLEVWLSSSQLILNGILFAKHGYLDETESSKRKHRQRNIALAQVEGVASRGLDSLDIAVSLLESGRELYTKFSTLLCERALPTAKDVYLKDLPSCYPTLQHNAHLEKALHAFNSMVRGPAVQLFAKKLEDECTSTWKSGRQLCDAVSLTGKPCMHQTHDVVVKPHSSGYFFLHACVCGRSRQLRPDPFDFETANIAFNCFPDCDKFLPAVQLPEGSNAGLVQSSSWSLVRVGGARYYEPSKGLLQSGFSAKQKFLLKWTIFLEKPTEANDLPTRTMHQVSVTRPSTDLQVENNAEINRKKASVGLSYTGAVQNGVENQRKPSENVIFGDKKISFGKGLPNFTMRKPFSEVVSGSSAADSGFPPLQQRKQPSSGLEKDVKQNRSKDRSAEQVHAPVGKGSKKSQDISSDQETFNKNTTSGGVFSNPFLQIGSYVDPMSTRGGETVKSSSTLKNVTLYVGFEHECPHGHRFLLSLDHLNEFGSSYSLFEESQVPSAEIPDHNPSDPSNLGKNVGHGKIHRGSKSMTVAATNKPVSRDKSKEISRNGNIYVDGLVSRLGKEQNKKSVGVPTHPDFVNDPDADLHSVILDDGVSALSLLNRNLPIYMNCPYCRLSKNKKDLSKIKFAGTISQLQRIYLVTPPFPILLATCPVIKFEPSCLPPSVPDHEQKLQFSPGCKVILPPDSFLTVRLPFVYGVQLEDRMLPLNAFEHKPEMTAWIVKGTTLQVISKGSSIYDRPQT